MHVASVVLSAHVTTAEQLEERLSTLREHCPPAPYCARFAIIVGCFSRGVAYWSEEGVETRAFHRFFPDTPIAGFFGDGEYGHTVLPPVAARVQGAPSGVGGAGTASGACGGVAKGRPEGADKPASMGYTTVFTVLTIL